MALIPGSFGVAVLIFGALLFILTMQNSIQLLRPHEGASSLLRRLFVTTLSLLVYVVQCYYGVQLIVKPHDSGPVYSLTTLLLVVYVLGVFRAWELLGGTRKSPIELLTPKHQQEGSHPHSDEDAPSVPR